MAYHSPKIHTRGGRVTKEEHYLGTITYWEVVDDLFMLAVKEAGGAARLDTEELRKNTMLRHIFMKNPSVRENALVVKNAMDELYKKVKLDFLAYTDDFVDDDSLTDAEKMHQTWCFHKSVEAFMKRTPKESEHYSQGYQKGYEDNQRFHSFFEDKINGKLEKPVGLSADEENIFKKMFKSYAMKIHPDHGGNHKDMQVLNAIKDKILRKP